MQVPFISFCPQPAMQFLANCRSKDIILAKITNHTCLPLAPPTKQLRSGIPCDPLHTSTFWTGRRQSGITGTLSPVTTLQLRVGCHK